MMNKNIHTLIKENFETELQNLTVPPFETLLKGKKIIEQRKKTVEEEYTNDFYYFIARFLNLNIKLYQLVICSSILVALYLVNTNSKISNTQSKNVNFHEEKLNTVISSTIMTSIKTTKTI